MAFYRYLIVSSVFIKGFLPQSLKHYFTGNFQIQIQKGQKQKFDQSLKIITLLKQKFLIDNMNEIKQII